jgi:hypothetical protein
VRRSLLLLALGAAAAVSGLSIGTADAKHSARAEVRQWTIHYRAHDGRTRVAYVLLPAWYGSRHNPPLPLVISPHGRGVDGRANARLWGNLPAVDRLAVVSPDGEGRRLPLYSWGAPGQIADLKRMPRLVKAALPWLRVARHSTYAIAGSMGGQETLLLVARDPELAGAAVFDAPTDFALQYSEFPDLPCDRICLSQWREPIGTALQRLARVEVGGSPNQVPGAYEQRSPLHYVAAIARSGVPLQFWWSTRDRLIPEPARQEGRFLRALERLRPRGRVMHVVGSWRHVRAMRRNLPAALAWFHLSPSRRSS